MEGMDMPEVEDINMLEEHECLLNQRLEVEGMNMAGIHIRGGGYEYGGGATVEVAAGGGGYEYGERASI
jgi:hypothetical protein